MGELREWATTRKHTEGRWENSGNGRQQKYIQTTVFVSNLPPRLHWQGLWFAFARYGDVIDAFIPAKKSKTGFRYGFVRFLKLEDAERAISHLSGSVLYGNRLNASLARFSDKLEDRKSKQMKNNVLKNEEASKIISRTVGNMSSDSQDSQMKPRLKRVLGHVEEEALKKLEKCLIGTMATVCSTCQVQDRLQAWGLNDVTVKYMGGCRFLIDIKDQEVKSKLQLQEWAILKEVFSEVEAWTEVFHLPERTTWIQVTGVPLHCWNLTTFKRIVDYWGSLISLGENASQSIDCEKVTLLISTQHKGRINEVIEVEVGRDCFLVQVDELGLNFHPKQSDVPLQSKAKKSVEYSLGSSSDPSSVPDHSTAQTNGSRFNCIEEDEVAKAICLEKGSLVNEFSSEINAMTSLGEKVFLGNLQFEELSPLNNLKTSIPNQISSEAVPSISNVNSVEAFGPSTQLDHQVVRWVDVVTKNLVSQGDRVGEDLTQLHNRNLVLDPCTGQEGCEASFRRNPTDEEVGLSLSATKGIIEGERPILSDGIMPNIINRFCSVQLMPIVAEVC
ncbi:hypothetical protein GQ457_05G034330 [Hibiscus cannabinus]